MRNKRMNPLMKTTAYLLIGGMTIAFLFLGGKDLIHVAGLQLNGGTAIGTITDMDYSVDRSNDFFRMSKRPNGANVMFTPHVLFFTKDGKPVDFISNVSSDSPAYNLDDKVIVLYNPVHPEDAILKDWCWMFSVIFLSAGILTGLGLYKVIQWF